VADRIRADLDLIKDCSNALFAIHKEFDKHGNPADGYDDVLGSDTLRGVFDDFSDTWKKNRKKLMKDIENLAKFTADTAKSYDKLDHELANALRDVKKSGKKGKK
jgi:gas vesicle protein